MKQLLKSLIILSAMGASSQAGAQIWADFRPTIGIDYKATWLRGHDSWKDILPRSYSGGTIYLAARWCDFGVEAGYDWTGRKTRTNFFVFSFLPFDNVNITNSSGLITNAAVRIQEGYFDLQAFLPLDCCFELFAGIGVGVAKARLNIQAFSSNSAFNDAFASVDTDNKALLRLNVGARYMFTPCVGIRGRVGWENTSRIRLRGDNNFNTFIGEDKLLRDDVTLAFGLFYNF